jgi:hypothetical protein
MSKGKKYIQDMDNIKFISSKTNLFPNVIEDIIRDYLSRFNCD